MPRRSLPALLLSQKTSMMMMLQESGCRLQSHAVKSGRKPFESVDGIKSDMHADSESDAGAKTRIWHGRIAAGRATAVPAGALGRVRQQAGADMSGPADD